MAVVPSDFSVGALLRKAEEQKWQNNVNGKNYPETRLATIQVPNGDSAFNRYLQQETEKASRRMKQMLEDQLYPTKEATMDTTPTLTFSSDETQFFVVTRSGIGRGSFATEDEAVKAATKSAQNGFPAIIYARHADVAASVDVVSTTKAPAPAPNDAKPSQAGTVL